MTLANLKIPVVVDISEIESLIDEIKHLQTYKLFPGDEQILVDRDDVVKIFADHVRAERKKGEWIDETFEPWGLVYHPYKCDQCGEHSETISNFCPNCGAKMEVEE